MSNNDSWIGKKLSDRYEIEELIGQGGMASVYKATDPNLHRTVAIKLIHSHLSNDPEFVSRFEEEAAAVAQIRHSNIIQVFDFDNEGDDYYMVLEYILGETLQDKLKRLVNDKQFMPLEEAIQIIASICDALHYTHTRGMIHRDIKPANIMINVEGQAILMDFGIAKIVGGKEHTATGAVVGTARYMSPEIIKGEKPDFSVDIYSAGVTLFESISGKPPFVADSVMSTLMMHINDPVPDLREINDLVPEALVEVIGKALEKDKKDRYKSASDFSEALRSIDLSADTKVSSSSVDSKSKTLKSDPIAAPPDEIPASEQPSRSKTSKGKKGKSWVVVLVAGIIISVIAYLGINSLSATTEDTQNDEPVEIVIVTETVTPEATLIPTEIVIIPTETIEIVIVPTETAPPEPFVLITNILVVGNAYSVEYATYGYTEVLPGQHIHFFFNNVSPEQAGVGGSGPWYVWGGPRPFDKYTVAERPTDATQICALVANPNHTIILNTGNCFDLPE